MASYLDQLIQEFSMPDIAGQAGIDPMQDLQVAQEPQGIDRLTALMQQQQELQQRQRDALTDYSALAAKRLSLACYKKTKRQADSLKTHLKHKDSL